MLFNETIIFTELQVILLNVHNFNELHQNLIFIKIIKF
jgi:hypothetical protein